jgi:hypothetical protein
MGEWHTLLDGFGLSSLRSYPGLTTHGRAFYLDQVAATLSAHWPLPIVDVCVTGAPPGAAPAVVDHARFLNNPLRSGSAAVEFGLAAADRVEVRLYDVAGRLVRTLADRLYPAGEHHLVWDGADDTGRPAARGVYFARVRFAARGFERTTRLVVLK